MAYKGVGWKNYPSTTTPINAENLNVMDDQIIELSKSSHEVVYDAPGDVAVDSEGNITDQVEIPAAPIAHNSLITIILKNLKIMVAQIAKLFNITTELNNKIPTKTEFTKTNVSCLNGTSTNITFETGIPKSNILGITVLTGWGSLLPHVRDVLDNGLVSITVWNPSVTLTRDFIIIVEHV